MVFSHVVPKIIPAFFVFKLSIELTFEPDGTINACPAIKYGLVKSTI